MARGPLASFSALSWLLIAQLGCAPRAVAPDRDPASAPRQGASVKAPASVAGAAWRYEVRLTAEGELDVDASFGPTPDPILAVDEPASRFVTQVEWAQGGQFVAATAQGPGWRVPCGSGCRVRYRFLLRSAAVALHDIDLAIASGDAWIAPPSTWLLSPLSAPRGAELAFHVDAGPDTRFACGFARAANGAADSYVLPAGALDDSSFAAFGALHVADIPAGDTSVRLALAPKDLALSASQVEAWVSMSANAVANYYQGHLPARHALVVIMKGSGTSTRGETLGGGGPAVLVRAADSVTPTTTRDDWVVTHELLHANFPDLGREHSWLSEGLATYVEPIARARVGLVDERKFWRDLVEGLPHGLPEPGDQGLEHTHTWGRTYWGGALYCLLADVTIRERTGNARSLDDVLRSIGKTGDVDDVHWKIEQFLAAGQAATGTPVLRELYDELAEKPGTVNLSALFTRLGVVLQNGALEFDDRAPLAPIRRAITAR
jgi:hypothetical protein